MELLLSRNQRTGKMGFGGIKFVLNAKSKLTEDEKTNVKKYKMGDVILYEKAHDHRDATVSSMLARKFLVQRITVNDLVAGKEVESEDIMEIMGAEEQLRDAAKNFHSVLKAASQFGGDEVVTFS